MEHEKKKTLQEKKSSVKPKSKKKGKSTTKRDLNLGFWPNVRGLRSYNNNEEESDRDPKTKGFRIPLAEAIN